jgi:hypothetical protein
MTANLCVSSKYSEIVGLNPSAILYRFLKHPVAHVRIRKGREGVRSVLVDTH